MGVNYNTGIFLTDRSPQLEYYHRNKSRLQIEHRERSSKYYYDNKEKIIKKWKSWKEKYPERYKAYENQRAERRKKIRLLVIAHYSNNENKCACCNQDNIDFLTIDHINGGGNQHRKSTGMGQLALWLYNHGLPEGYRILCYNCNNNMWKNGGKCVHNDISIKRVEFDILESEINRLKDTLKYSPDL